MSADPIRLDTSAYGPLSLRLYAGPTSNLDTTYARDGRYPQSAHVIGRTPEPSYVGARVGTADGEFLTINGVDYSADASFTLAVGGWAEEFGSYGPLTRRGTFLTDRAVSDAARRVWRERIVPLILAALADASQEVTQAETEARADLAAYIVARIAELRAEADRLETLMV